MKFNEYEKIFKSFLLNESITYEYKAPRDLQKQCMDFFILSLVWKNDSSKNPDYKKYSTNQDLKNILEKSIKEIVKYQRANLYKICISILALEIFQNAKSEEEFSNISKIKNKWDTYKNKNYFRIIPDIAKVYDITPNKLVDLAQRSPEKSLHVVSGIIQILKSSEELDDQIDNIKLIYDKIRKNQWIIDRLPPSKFEWKKFIDDIYNGKKWNITQSSSIPTRIINYLAKYKGININEKLIDKSKEIKQLSETTKQQSFDLLFSYITEREDIIYKALKYQFKDFDKDTIHDICNEEFFKSFAFDAVYNNKKYKIPKSELLTNFDSILSLDPFRYYDDTRESISVWLDEKSKTRKKLENKIEKLPKSFEIEIDSDFEDYKKHFLKNNKIQLLGNAKQQDLIEFEVLYP